jgi:citrate lyase subunit beta / citryl-CoA lyase
METGSRLAAARTLLFVPGNRPERFDKALSSGADAVVLDLEDSVPAAAKAQARESVSAACFRHADQPTPIVVRINGLCSDAGREDLAWLSHLQAPFAVMLAKTESAGQVQAVSHVASVAPVLPLIESAEGLVALPEIARARAVLRLVVGHIDFMADTGIRCSDDERELDALRFAVSLHSRVNRLAAPVDGVTVAIGDADRLRVDTQRALRFGFGAKLCIHPRQIESVHGAMRPTDTELEWARRVLEADRASGGAALQLDGRMIDLPVVLQAQMMMARAQITRSAV